MLAHVHIREANDADATAITDIHNAQGVATTAYYGLDDGTVAERIAWLAEHHKEGYPVFVAEVPDDQGRPVIVGFVAYSRFRDLEGYDYTVEHSVYTAPGFEHQGIGAALMDRLIAKAREAGLHAMVGVIAADNAGSIAFHTRLGFQHCGVLPQIGRKFDRWLDVTMMVLVLDADHD